MRSLRTIWRWLCAPVNRAPRRDTRDAWTFTPFGDFDAAGREILP